MDKNMEDIDKMIKASLSQEEASFYEELDEQNLMQMVSGLFKTRIRWIMILMNLVNIVSFGLFIYCVVQFVNATETAELIKWSAAGGLAILTSSMLKIFAWMQMDKNAIFRELKRLELQVSSLAGKM